MNAIGLNSTPSTNKVEILGAEAGDELKSVLKFLLREPSSVIIGSRVPF
jgi:hypothetical protein